MVQQAAHGRFGLTLGLQAVSSKTAHTVKQAPARRGCGFGHAQQGMFEQASQGVEQLHLVADAGHGASRLQRETAGKHRQVLQQPQLGGLQQRTRPGQRGAQRAVAFRRAAFTACQQCQAFAQARMHTRPAQQRHPRGRQLQRQRQAVQQAADGHCVLHVRVFPGQPRLVLFSALVQQLHGGTGGPGGRVVGAGRHGQRAQRQHLFTGHAQRQLAGHQQAHTARLAQQGRHQRGHGSHQVLCTVQHQQQLQWHQRTGQRRHVGVGAAAQAQRAGQGVQQQCGFGQCVQPQQPDAVTRRQVLCGSQREPRFARACGAVQRHQAVRGQGGQQVLQLVGAAQQSGCGGRQVARRHGHGRQPCCRAGQGRIRPRRWRKRDRQRATRQGIQGARTNEAITPARHGLQVLRRLGVFTQSHAQGVDRHLQHRVTDMAVAPHGIQQLVFGHQATATASQEHQHVEVTRPQRHRLALAAQPLRRQVELKGTKNQALLQRVIGGHGAHCSGWHAPLQAPLRPSACGFNSNQTLTAACGLVRRACPHCTSCPKPLVSVLQSPPGCRWSGCLY